MRTGGISYVSGASTAPLIGETIGNHLDRVAARWPERLALVARQQGIRWTWRELAAHPVLLRVVSVTAIHASAQFVLFSYLVIAYRDALRAPSHLVASLLGVMGAAGFVGNVLAGRLADRHGPPAVVLAVTPSEAWPRELVTTLVPAGNGSVVSAPVFDALTNVTVAPDTALPYWSSTTIRPLRLSPTIP